LGQPLQDVAATHFILGERFDEDPFLLFRLRGRSQEQILHALRQRRAGEDVTEEETEEEQEEITPLEETLSAFWQPGESLESFPLNIKPPMVVLPILKRLGEPAFMSGDTLQNLLGPAYQAITQAALAAAFAGGEEQEAAEPGEGA
jgi:uncharacterized Zn finger protein